MKWRNGERPDPEVERDLAAVDAGAAGQPAPDPARAPLAELGADLHALREEPTPEFRADLDRRMASDFARGRAEERQAGAEPRRRRSRIIPGLFVAVPAAAAVAIAVILVAGTGSNDSGPGKLPVAVQSQGSGATGGTAAPPPSGSALSRPGGPSAPAISLASTQVAAGEPLVLRYDAPKAGSVFVSLSPIDGGSSTSTRRVRLPAGSGKLRIATDDLTGGHYALVVSLPSGQSALKATVNVLD
jgi:hypothetical protein